MKKEPKRITGDWQKLEGTFDPPGATWLPEEQAWNFVICSKNAEKIELLLYSKDDYTEPAYTYEFRDFINKSGPLWHCRIKHSDIPEVHYYAYRVWGPSEDAGFHSFDPEKLLMDPYAKSVFFPPEFDRETAKNPGPNDGKAPLGVLEIDEDFDWGDDFPITHGSELVIYEMHVRGFTYDPSSGMAAAKRGTFAGVTEKISYLKELGVTAVELMPVFQFDPQENNYWGYMTLNFFSPHNMYTSSENSEDFANEFREMVKELHKAGIEVILDVVYNHTCEGDERGPTYSYKGIDNSLYYIPAGEGQSRYANFTGCGNVLDPHISPVRKLITDSLTYWREEMHVDGFRFDLASIFVRSSDGSVNSNNPPIFGQITSGKHLLNMRRIAEPWDAAGTFQLGRDFPGWLWMQWNAKYRDVLQRVVKGDSGQVSELMTRLYGSADLFPDDTMNSCRPWQSVNYITSHDGSSLYDMVSYERKYNLANGENNRDGCHEFKWNCGIEGDENVPDEVIALRKQQVKNFFAILMLSNGTPMFRMGDEFMQTQGGNNNPYNQDNEISWLNWDRLEENRDVFFFIKELIAFRRRHPSISRSHFWRKDVTWYGSEGDVDYSDFARTLAFCLRGEKLEDQDLYVMINMSNADIEFRMQAEAPGGWERAVDTAFEGPDDLLRKERRTPLEGGTYQVSAHSIVVLISVD